jgi:uncharacterized protein (DUF1800 family)
MNHSEFSPLGSIGQKWAFYLCLHLFVALAAVTAFSQDIVDSPDPVLITEANSTRALTANVAGWRGNLPVSSTAQIYPGATLLIFVGNLDLMSGEGPNAFRVAAQDGRGRKFHLAVEDIRPVAKRQLTYALKVRVFDAGGYNGQPGIKGGLSISVKWRGNASNQARLSSRPVISPDPDGLLPAPASSVPTGFASRGSTAGDRKRFMEQASFGPTNALDFRLRQIGIRRWIDEQIAMPYPTIPHLNAPLKPNDGAIGCGGVYGDSPEIDLCYRTYYWAYTNQKWFLQEALYGDDQLRRRVSWALHQIWVISENTLYMQRWMQEYIEILDRHAFGNYRDLMFEMSLSPGMGEYLDMVRSTRMSPNENYPRELLQLFTVGLDRLNPDGTLMLDTEGNRIPTYDQAKINEFTKVFTGFTRCDNGLNPACPSAVPGSPNYIDPMYLSDTDKHDRTAKTLFEYPGAPGSFIPACSSCSTDAERIAYANQSINQAIDNIFHHPNVGPFVAKLMIQHLVTGNPTPAFVGRVAAAFNNNGAGVRGDMKAVVKAVLLDPEARGSRKTDPTYGKLREPILYLTNILRMFNVGAGAYSNDVPATPPASCQNRSDGVFAWVTGDAGQEVWYPPNVFSYYSPFAVVPGTDIGGPEFALAHTGSSVRRNNIAYAFTASGGIGFDQPTAAVPSPWAPCGTNTYPTEEIAWAASDPTGNTVIERLNAKMMHGTMSEAMKAKIRSSISTAPNAEYMARQVMYLIASSSQYQIQR